MGVFHSKQYASSADPVDGTDWNAGHVDEGGNTTQAIASPFTFATLPAAASNSGVVARVTDVGRAGGSLWMSDGTIWRPVAPVKIYENTGLITGISSGTEQVVLAIPYVANILTGKIFRLLCSMGRNGTTDAWTTLTLRMGANGTTADTAIATYTTVLTGGSARSQGVDNWSRMASVTSVEKFGKANAGSSFDDTSASGAVLNAATTVTTVASAGYIDVCATMSGTTDKPQLGYVALEIQP
jgi:hypothetical protein